MKDIALLGLAAVGVLATVMLGSIAVAVLFITLDHALGGIGLLPL